MNGFTQVKTQELTGAALDWVVGKITGVNIRIGYSREVRVVEVGNGYIRSDLYSPSTNWAQGGPMWEKHATCMQYFDGWLVAVNGGDARGLTQLEALCRAIVSAKLGNVVQVPADLLEAV